MFDANAEQTGIAAAVRVSDLGIGFKDLATRAVEPRGHLRRPGPRRRAGSGGMRNAGFNGEGVAAIYRFEMARACRTLRQSLVTPVITTSLYFVVFGAAIGSRMTEVDGVDYGSLHRAGTDPAVVIHASIFNASFGIYFPKFTGTIYEFLSAPISYPGDRPRLCRRGRNKSIVLGLVILVTATLSCRSNQHPFWMIAFLVLDGRYLQLVRLHHRHLGQDFRATAVHPDADHHAADLPGGAFYSIDMLPPAGARSPCSTRWSI